MLTNLEVYSPRSSVPTLALGNNGPSTDAIQVRGIEGLGPVKASVNTTPLGSIDGESYMGSSVGKRNIVITFGLNPNWVDQTVSSLRQLLYAYFMPKQSIKLRFMSSTMVTVDIEGYVEGVEPNIFSKDPEVQVSIICPKPDFVASSATVVVGTVGDGQVSTEINYNGTTPTGFVLKIESSTAKPTFTGNIQVVNETPFTQVFSLDVTINAQQYFEMSSVAGAKYVRTVLIGDGSITNLLRRIATNAVWPRLDPGLNGFKVVGAEVGQTWTLTYFSRFGGL